VVPEYDDDKIDYGYGFASWGDEKGLGKHLILNGIQRWLGWESKGADGASREVDDAEICILEPELL